MYTLTLYDRKANQLVGTLIEKFNRRGEYAWAKGDALKPALVMQFAKAFDAQAFMENYMDPYDPVHYEVRLVHYKPKGPKGLYGRHSRKNPVKQGAPRHRNPAKYTVSNTVLEVIEHPSWRMRLRDRTSGKVLSTRAEHNRDLLVKTYFTKGKSAMHKTYVRYVNSK